MALSILGYKAVGVENYTFEAQTTHLRLHYTSYANDFVSAT